MRGYDNNGNSAFLIGCRSAAADWWWQIFRPAQSVQPKQWFYNNYPRARPDMWYATGIAGRCGFCGVDGRLSVKLIDAVARYKNGRSMACCIPSTQSNASSCSQKIDNIERGCCSNEQSSKHPTPLVKQPRAVVHASIRRDLGIPKTRHCTVPHQTPLWQYVPRYSGLPLWGNLYCILSFWSDQPMPPVVHLLTVLSYWYLIQFLPRTRQARPTFWSQQWPCLPLCWLHQNSVIKRPL